MEEHEETLLHSSTTTTTEEPFISQTTVKPTTFHPHFPTSFGHHDTTTTQPSLSSMQQQLDSLDSTDTIKYLIHRLQTRLDGLGQSSRTRLSDLKLPSSPKTAKSLFTSSTAHNATALDHGGSHHDHGGHDHNDSAPDHDGLLLHSDTIILVSSMVVMIILGLVLYQIMAYFTNRNNRRDMYQSGVRTLTEAMHGVAGRLVEVEPRHADNVAGAEKGEKSKGGGGGGYGSGVNSFELEVPSTPTGRKRALCDSPSTARVLREARRGTIFKPPTNIIIRDEDMDGMVCQTVSQQAHFRKLEQIHQREYEQEKLKKSSVS